MEKFIETLNSFGADDKKYISVDRNASGEIFITIKDKAVSTDSFEDIRLELERDEAFELANQILRNLFLYPDDQVERLNKGLRCACDIRKKYAEESEEEESEEEPNSHWFSVKQFPLKSPDFSNASEDVILKYSPRFPATVAYYEFKAEKWVEYHGGRVISVDENSKWTYLPK